MKMQDFALEFNKSQTPNCIIARPDLKPKIQIPKIESSLNFVQNVSKMQTPTNDKPKGNNNLVWITLGISIVIIGVIIYSENKHKKQLEYFEKEESLN